MGQKYTHDIIVIGAGSGGLNIASFMNKAGFSVLLVDKSDKDIGGDCLNYGCVPSKSFIHISKLARYGTQMKRFGLKYSGKVNLASIMKEVDAKKEYIRTHENAAYFRKQGMDVKLGFAQFVSPQEIVVGKSSTRYSAKRIILATGASPRKLSIPGIEKVDIHTYESIFSLKKLPSKLVIVGGGPIGMELGQAFLSLGSSVIIVEHGDQFLPKEDKEIANVLREQLEMQGMKFMFNVETVRFSSKDTLIVKDKTSGKEKTLSFDVCLSSIGRTLNINNLGLANAGIKVDSSGHKLVVDSYLRTTNKNVFVCGDVAGSYQFTHAAEMHASVILRNFFLPRILWKKINYDMIAWVTYTSPEIATFGLNTTQLESRSITYKTLSYDFLHDDRAITDEQTYGKAKIHISSSGRILGGSMVAEHAGELIHELVLAMTSNMHIKEFMKKVYPYPTAGRVNKYIFRPHFSEKLYSSWSKKIMRFLY